ncbi:XRE family transcriptional regulator [Streptomyces sp. SR27]|uniref:XRE family transcriptional regulator n=1 Tax=Streptomyces sp. SR27 TaxID=3076630 RepID=UPI00295B7AC8|nr:XRE family transcriptional regulator [Streptomyces sp. SR27]MDV9187655.1 XRE family transcriptional regulator [Streptomyces sp. SR27]
MITSDGEADMKHPMYAPHPVEAQVRACIAAVLNMTGETYTSLGELLKVTDVMIGRRQRGLAPWSMADLGRLADHWGISPWHLVAGPSEALAELSPARVDELRAARGLRLFSAAH